MADTFAKFAQMVLN